MIRDTLRSLRVSSQLTQAAIAEGLQIDKTAVSKIESGARSATYEEVQKWALLCGRTVDLLTVREVRLVELLRGTPSERLDEVAQLLEAAHAAPGLAWDLLMAQAVVLLRHDVKKL